MRSRALLIAAGALLAVTTIRAAAVSPLFARGYTVVPEPQKVGLGDRDFRLSDHLALRLEAGVKASDGAVEALRQDLEARFGVRLERQAKPTGLETGAPGAPSIRLAIIPKSVEIGDATDSDKEAVAQQAYKLELAAEAIRISANASPGLFYGVQTLIQLIKRRDGALWLPEGRIEDWPDLRYRAIYWDDAHHLDRPDYLKRAVRQAAFFKINGFVIKLEGHFQYKSAPALVEPYALSAAEFQELTDYGLRYHVQVIPYLDSPAHIAFILKHPAYARLRAFPQSNYELCVTNPDSYKLLFGMFQDLLDANKGVNYFYLSTDEAYYIGLADNSQCNETARAKELGSVGKVLAEFLTKAAGYLHDRGRTVIFWGEYPLKPDDITSLPKYLVNGETYGPAFDPLFKAHGIRSMIYSSTQGEEKLFPSYYPPTSSRRLRPGPSAGDHERVADNFRAISFSPARKQAEIIGMVNAGWADMGLHPETFWLGYVASTAAGWHPASPQPEETMSAFYTLFYGEGATGVGRIYQLMSRQAQFFADSWDTAPSKARKPIFGNSDHIWDPPRPARDQTLPLPSVPSPENLTIASKWTEENQKRLELAAELVTENEELLGLLYSNLPRVEFNRYNLEVFVSVAQLCRQNLRLLQSLAAIDRQLEAAQAAAAKGDARQATAALDRALDLALAIKDQRNRALHDTVETWYKSWFPRLAEANGRRFLHELDDVKDHLPDRTVDMSFLVYRQLLLPFGDWHDKVQSARNDYAKKHDLPARQSALNWNDTGL